MAAEANVSMEQNKSVAQRWADELWNAGNFASTPELIAEDFVCHGMTGESAGEIHGRDGHDAWIRAARTATPDFHVVFDDLIAEGDKVAGRWTVRGTAATGQPVQTIGIHIYRFVDGKIAEMWNEFHSVA